MTHRKPNPPTRTERFTYRHAWIGLWVTLALSILLLWVVFT